MANTTFLEKLLLGSRPPSPVQGFLSPNQEEQYRNQEISNLIYGGLEGYAKNINKGNASKALGILQGARSGRNDTGNIYLNALKGQQGLTKGMLDVLNAQATNTKTNLENDALTLQKQGQFNNYYEALKNGNYTLANAILMDAKGSANQILKSTMPDAPKLSEGAFAFKNFLQDRGIKQNSPAYNKAMLNYANATTDEKKQELAMNFMKELGVKFPSIQKPSITSKTDVSNMLDIPTQNIFEQHINSQYIPPTQINVPSTNINNVKDLETYNLGDYKIDFNDNEKPNLTKKVINDNNVVSKIQEYEINTANKEQQQTGKTFQERYENIPPNIKNKFNITDNGILANQKMSITRKQKLFDEAPNKLLGTAKNINQLNELHQNLSQLVHHKGFNDLFSKGGDVAALTSNDAINARKLFQKIQKTIGKIDLVQMKRDSPNGATPVGQLNFSELQMMLDSITEAEFGGSPEFANNAFLALSKKLYTMKSDIVDYTNLLYKDPNSRIWNKFADKINYNYIESPEINGLDGEIILTGAVMNSHTGTSKFDINKYYFKVPNEEGGYDTVINPKTNAELTLDDIKFNRF